MLILVAQGAKPNVIRGMRGPITNTESQPCPVCRTHELRFFFDEIGRTVERCSNRRCAMHHPHKPVPDGYLPAGLTSQEKRRERLRERRKHQFQET